MFLISLSTMIVADVVFVAIMGIRGAAVGVLLSCLVEFSAFAYMFQRSTNLGLRDICVIRLSDVILIKNRLLNSISRKQTS